VLRFAAAITAPVPRLEGEQGAGCPADNLRFFSRLPIESL
jgi:hypothetical protein